MMASLLEKNHDLNPSHLQMVEDALDTHFEFKTKNDLLRALPEPIPIKELDKIIDHLEKFMKIMYGENNVIIWLCHNDPEFEKIWDNAHDMPSK